MKDALRMGRDFSALMEYAGPSGGLLSVLARLERGEEGAAFQDLVEQGRRAGYAFVERAGRKAAWRSFADFENKLRARPILPSLEACLDLPSNFLLTFGQDAVWMYHTLRWAVFLTEEEWQRVMLATVDRLCVLLGARACIITNDEHPAIAAFREGATFTEALEAASRQGEGEVSSLGELYREVERDSELAMKPVSGPAAHYLEGQLVLWPRDQPLPEGWVRPTEWESKGYWRSR